MEIVRRAPQSEVLNDLHPVLARVFSHRAINRLEDIDTGLGKLTPPTSLPDIEPAADRLCRAIRADEHILVVGDFDADGATSVALCELALKGFGAKRVSFIVPNRFAYGYGLTPEIVALAIERQPQVIVTVDNGVASVAGVDYANQHGVDVIVTDHHLPGSERPNCLALVNPNLPESDFPSKALAGVGVAYYVLSVVRKKLREQGWFAERPEPNMADYLDLVALGTVADVVPLDINNRRLVQQGLLRMRAGRCRPGIKALVEIGRRTLSKLTAQDLGFAVGPRLNAAGRLEDMAIGIKCLLAESMTEARDYARMLDRLNTARRELEQEMVSDAEVLLATEQADHDRAGLVVYHPSFHQGVVGIVAGRVRERFHRPAIVFADAGDQAQDELKGSARSIDGLHIRDVLDGIATSHPGLLLKFGGHAMAAGLSIRRVHFERFATVFDKAVWSYVAGGEDAILKAQIQSDGVLQAADLELDLALMIADAGPWGAAFPEPAFDGEFEVVSQRVVGEQHLKLVLKAESRVVDAIAFRTAKLPDATQRVRCVYRLQENDYGQVSTLQLVVEYLEPLA